MLTKDSNHMIRKKILLKLLILLLLIIIPSLVAAEQKLMIKGATENEIITKNHRFRLTPYARIYDQNGKKIAMEQFPAPCMAMVTFEPQPGNALPLVNVVNIIKVLPDPTLHRNRVSRYPE
jgi:hypothetical protein